MAKYTMVCSEGHETEVIMGMFLSFDVICTKMIDGKRCNQKMRRKFTPPYIMFRGSGFYSTDKKR